MIAIIRALIASDRYDDPRVSWDPALRWVRLGVQSQATEGRNTSECLRRHRPNVVLNPMGSGGSAAVEI